jgi:hypothetical protein
MHTTTCEDLVDDLAATADGTVRLARGQRRHVERCLRCQADLAQHRKLLRALRSLRDDVLDPAPGLLTDILAGLDGEPLVASRHAMRSLLSGRRVAYVGGLAAATAAGAVSAIVLTTSRRRARLAG